MTNKYCWLGCSLTVLFLGACHAVDESNRLDSTNRFSVTREFSTAVSIRGSDNIEIRSNDDASVIRGSGQIVSESRTTPPFTQIDCRLGEVEIVQGDRESITISADDNILPHIIAQVRDRTLYLYPEENMTLVSSPIRIRVQVRELDGLVVSESLKVKVENLKTDRLYLEGIGSTEVAIASLEADELQVQMQGSNQLEITGEVTHQQVKFAGSSEYDGAQLESQTIDLNLSGSSNATVWAARKLDVQLDGTGDVKYYGNPRVTEDIRGSLELQHLGNR